MLNLMRFHERSLDGDGSGWDAYLRYSALTVPDDQGTRRHAAVDRRRQGGRARAAGRQSNGTFVALVYYPTVCGLHRHDDVGGLRDAGDPHRVNGCAEHVIIATKRGLQQVQDEVAPSRGTLCSPCGQRAARRVAASRVRGLPRASASRFRVRHGGQRSSGVAPPSPHKGE